MSPAERELVCGALRSALSPMSFAERTRVFGALQSSLSSEDAIAVNAAAGEATALGAGADASAEEAHGWHELEASPAELLADMSRERVARALRRERGAVGRLLLAPESAVSRAQTSEHRARLRRACAHAQAALVKKQVS